MAHGLQSELGLASTRKEQHLENRDSLLLVATAIRDDAGHSALTRALHERDMPESFDMVAGGVSLLQRTVACFQAAVPSRPTYALVPAVDEERVRSQLRSWSAVTVVPLLDVRRSAFSLLSILAEVLADCPHAEVMVVPADCRFTNPESLVQGLLLVRPQLDLAPAIVLGASAPCPLPSGQCLVPGKRLGHEVYSLFQTKPQPCETQRTCPLSQRAMWNTSSFLARARFLWHVLARNMPLQANAIARLWRVGRPSPEEVAHVMGDAGSGVREWDIANLLLREAGAIAVARVDGLGWEDWAAAAVCSQPPAGSLELGPLPPRITASSPPPSRPPHS